MFQRAATAPPPVRTRWNFHISAGEEENLGDGGEEQQAKADPWENGHNGKEGQEAVPDKEDCHVDEVEQEGQGQRLAEALAKPKKLFPPSCQQQGRIKPAA